MVDMLHLLQDTLFDGQAATVGAFGALFWRPFVDMYQRTFLEQVGGGF